VALGMPAVLACLVNLTMSGNLERPYRTYAILPCQTKRVHVKFNKFSLSLPAVVITSVRSAAISLFYISKEEPVFPSPAKAKGL
jgi:hypothetical protein